MGDALIAAASSLAIAIATGLAWTSYNHHDVFQKIYPFMLNLLILTFFAGLAYNIGLLIAINKVALDHDIDLTKSLKLQNIIQESELPWYSALPVPIGMFYLVFLGSFASLGLQKRQ